MAPGGGGRRSIGGVVRGDTADAHPVGVLRPGDQEGSRFVGLSVALGILFIAASMVATALSYNVEARRLPIVTGVPTALLALLLVLSEGRRIIRRRGRSSPNRLSDRSLRNVGMPIVAFAAFIVAVLAVGLLAGSAVFTVMFLRLMGALSLFRSALFAAVMTWFLYLASSTLRIGLYSGHFF